MTDFSDRHTYLGASECGQVLNLNDVDWGTSYDLWEEKTLRAPRGPHKNIYDRGHRMEDVMCEILEQRYETLVYDRQKEFINKDRPWLRSHIDGMIDEGSPHIGEGAPVEQDGPGIVEFKAPGSAMVWSYKKEGVPENHQLQLYMNMYNSGCKWGVIVIMDYDNWDIIPIYFLADQLLIDGCLPFLDKFWACVKQDIAPPKQEEPYKLMGPSGASGAVVMDDSVLGSALAESHRELKKNEKLLSEAKGLIKGEMIRRGCNEMEMNCSNGASAKVTWKEVKGRTTVDGAKAVAWTCQMIDAARRQDADMLNKMISVFNPEMFTKIGKPSMRFTYKVKEAE